MSCVYVMTGIGTDIGKTYVTGELLRRLRLHGVRATSFKLVQTGTSTDTISPDITAHRIAAGLAPDDVDYAGLSCGAQFNYPASPHLAAALQMQSVDVATLGERLRHYVSVQNADIVFCEGAGGIFVPLTTDILTVDWISENHLPFILVCHAALGSIHHTIATLDALALRHLSPALLIYNPFPQDDILIVKDSEHFLRKYVERHYPMVDFWTLTQEDALPKILTNIC